MVGIPTASAATMSGALVFGMTLALWGRLKEAAVRQRFSLPTQLQMLNLALPLLVLLSGVLLDIYGTRALLIAGSVLLAVALVSLSVRSTHPQALVSLLLAGLGASAVGTTATVLMPRTLFAAHETTASLHLGYVFIALGALLTPLVADVLQEKIGSRRTLAVFALAALLPAFLAVLPSEAAWPTLEPDGSASTPLTEAAMGLTALVLFFYAPLEAALSLWTFTLLAERQHDESEATSLLTGFWAAFLLSRLLIALAQHFDFLTEGWDRTLLVVPPLLTAVLLGNLAGASHRGRPQAGLILLGLLLGPLLPTLLAVLFRHVAPSRQGIAYGLVFAAGSLGSLVLAPLLTPRTQSPLQTALRLPIFLALLVTAAALVMGLMMP